jgi:hypothetical protein
MFPVLLKAIGDVLEKDESKDDVLVFGGIHVVAQGVGSLPQLPLEAERLTVIVRAASHYVGTAISHEYFIKAFWRIPALTGNSTPNRVLMFVP